MKTNELKKGDTVYLSNGFVAEIMDNKKGNVRLAKVNGYYGEEIGSIYAWDILRVVTTKTSNTFLEEIELTPAQEKARERVRKIFPF